MERLKKMTEEDRETALLNLEYLKKRRGVEVFGDDVDLRELIIPCNTLGSTVRRRNGKDYFFDQDYVLRSRPSVRSGKFYLDWEISTQVNGNVWAKAMATCEEGITADEFLERYLTTKIEKSEGYDFLERLCTRIEKPSFERIPGNKDRNTFDRIRVEVCINSCMFGTKKELLASLKDNMLDIDVLVLQRIEESKAFQRFGVPINVLALTSRNFASNYTLEYIFELKGSCNQN